MTILPPCGICRELLRFHYPDIDVILVDESTKDSKIIKIKSKYLLPFPYYKIRKKEKEAFVKETWCCRGHNDDKFNRINKKIKIFLFFIDKKLKIYINFY